MNESFLSFVWKYRLYSGDLHTTNNIPVTVIKPGEQSTHAGPDFFNARIRIGDTLWAGNVEIHVKAGDWYRHRHHHDPAYDNVILHVVHEADTDIIGPDHTIIPTIALNQHTDPDLLQRYRDLYRSKNKIPCGNALRDLDPLTLHQWLDRMLVERLEHKATRMELALQFTHNHWEEAFYQLLARNFGFQVNATPFEMLSRTLPSTLLMRHHNHRHQLEALLYGQAGFLNTPLNDDYPRQLQQEYQHLAAKYGLLPLDRHLWKLLRMRPANFPTMRLSQFAHLIHRGDLTLATLIEKAEAGALTLPPLTASPYWNHHYLFDKPAPWHSAALGSASVRNLIINTIAPSLFYYARYHHRPTLADLSLQLLKSIAAEQNQLLDTFADLGIEITDAYTGQALIGLYQNYCAQKKCLSCALGTKILRAPHPSTGPANRAD